MQREYLASRSPAVRGTTLATPATQAVTLDEYRLALIERLRACQDTAAVRQLLAEADLMLANGGLTRLTHDRFWETVEDDLRGVEEEAKSLPDRKNGEALAAIVVAARARIARYRARVANPSDP
jgi:hypothetical protein